MFKKGEIYLAQLNPKKGNEIGKLRPVLIYQTDMLNDIEHSTTIILPLSTHLTENTYPLRLKITKRDGLQQDSDVICDQIRSIDNKRIIKDKVADLTEAEILMVDEQIKIILEIG